MGRKHTKYCKDCDFFGDCGNNTCICWRDPDAIRLIWCYDKVCKFFEQKK